MVQKIAIELVDRICGLGDEDEFAGDHASKNAGHEDRLWPPPLAQWTERGNAAPSNRYDENHKNRKNGDRHPKSTPSNVDGEYQDGCLRNQDEVIMQAEPIVSSNPRDQKMQRRDNGQSAKKTRVLDVRAGRPLVWSDLLHQIDEVRQA